jgi:hypothetical protein
MEKCTRKLFRFPDSNCLAVDLRHIIPPEALGLSGNRVMISGDWDRNKIRCLGNLLTQIWLSESTGCSSQWKSTGSGRYNGAEALDEQTGISLELE